MRARTIIGICVIIIPILSFAATPPALINYQGVLRDGDGAPQNGNFDMIFRFYSASSGGTLLLTDTHNSGAPSNQVVVSNGLFTAQLGAGTIAAGLEPNLAEMFRDNAAVWLEIQVGIETLSPRVQVIASAYAQNAKTLNGNEASAFAAASHNQDASTITTGTLAVARGGTGLASPGTSGNVLTSNGTAWLSSAPATLTEVDGVIGNEVTNSANSTLTRSGSGTSVSPYTLALNLGSANNWTGSQTFSDDTYFPGSGVWNSSGNVGVGTASPTARLDIDGSFNVGTYSGEALDQSQTGGTDIWNGTSQWQSFTAGVTGVLTEVDIYLQSPYATSDTTGTLSIYSGEGTGGTLLATQSVVLKVAFGWHYFSIAIPPQVTSGQVYTFLVTVPGYTRTWWETKELNPYAGGRWWYDPAYDTMFKTWVSTGTGGGFSVTSGGNVGIGQSNPGFPLNFASTTGDKISLYGTSGAHYGLGIQDFLLQVHAPTSGDSIAFGYGSSGSFTELMRINGSGNVGIGTNAPAAGLHVLGSGWFAADSGALGSAAGKGIRVFMDTGSSPNIGRIFAYDYTAGASMDMTLQSNGGGVGIGNIVPAYKLQLNQDSAAKPNGGEWTNPSDLRLKKNIRPFSDGLDIVKRINPVRYQYNGLAGMPGDMECIGVIAQEMLPVAPYTVGTFKAKLDEKAETKTELLDFNASALTFVMINAIKELDAKISGGKGAEQKDGGSKAVSAPDRPEVVILKRLSDGNVAPAGAQAASTGEELFPVCEPVEVGDVLVTEPARPGVFCLGRIASDPGVFGIVTGSSATSRNESSEQEAVQVAVATSGVIYCKVDATYGQVRVNDLLCTSPTPGHAMKAPRPAEQGTVICKALEPMDSGTGIIKVLVMLR